MASRFLRKSVRRQIRDFDNFQNVYPNLRRSSDQTNLTFNNQSPFDDTKSIRFGVDGISFPSMTPSGYNSLPSSSISLSNMTKIRASSQEYLPDLPGNAQITPFNEVRVNIPGTEDYIATSSVYRLGFRSATRNKIGIPIDISTGQVKALFKLSEHDTIKDPDGPFYGSGSTGFVYYNFDLKRWEDIGLTEQYRGHMGDISSTLITSTAAIQYPELTASSYFMSQFRGSPTTYGAQRSPQNPDTEEVLNIYNTLGYGYIGSPTWFFDAPNATRYHATSSQTLKLSNYIRQPFLLEEIEFTIPISATRKNGGLGLFDIAETSPRDMDSLVFFIYRQTSGALLNSKRKIISYGTTTFYNSKIRQADSLSFSDNILSASVVELHKPVVFFDHGLSPTASFASSEITQTLNFKIEPLNTAHQNTLSTTINNQYYSISGSRSLSYKIGSLGWEGSDTDQFLSDELPLKSYIAGGGGFLPFKRFIGVRNTSPFADPNTQNVKNLNADPRLVYKAAVSSDFSYFGNSLFNEPAKTPYILFPNDEIIICAESLVCGVSSSVGTGYDSSYLAVTSSIHRILSGSARVTLYGSLVQNNQEKLFNSLNQNLVSPAIHELVFDPTEDSDQFLIGERYTYTGSYLDNFMTGSIFSRTRYVSSSLTAENSSVGARGSFERFVGLSSPEEVYYDCLTVDGRTVSSETDIFKYSPQFDLFAAFASSAGNYYFQTDGNLRPNYPYKSGKVRQLNTPKFGISALNAFYTGKDFKTVFFYTGKNQYSNFPYEIRSFASSSLPSSNYVAYGMLNVENQQPKAVFRPDKYGQFRDMLEQPFDAATFRIVGIVGPTEPPVVVKFVSASSEEVIPPQFTNSNNLSVYYTSSLPYFDGENRSRPSTFITSSNGQFVPTTIIFQT